MRVGEIQVQDMAELASIAAGFLKGFTLAAIIGDHRPAIGEERWPDQAHALTGWGAASDQDRLLIGEGEPGTADLTEHDPAIFELRVFAQARRCGFLQPAERLPHFLAP